MPYSVVRTRRSSGRNKKYKGGLDEWWLQSSLWEARERSSPLCDKRRREGRRRTIGQCSLMKGERKEIARGAAPVGQQVLYVCMYYYMYLISPVTPYFAFFYNARWLCWVDVARWLFDWIDVVKGGLIEKVLA